MSASSLLSTEDLTIGYGSTPVIRGIAADLRPGELVCLIGPNGAGKSTLMRTISGMQPPLAGRVLLKGEDLRAYAPRRLATELAVVLTERAGAGLLTAAALVELGRYPYTGWSGRLAEADRAAVRRAIAAVGAGELAHRGLAELSDGERQRVMIARALAQEPSLLVLDEVTAFLDLPRRVEIVRLLRDLAHRDGKAVLLSTHDLELALRSADRIWLLPRGGPLQTGLPEELVLSGAFDAVFAREGVEFDRAAGAFRLHRRPVAAVEVSGEGLLAVWTARVAERLGYEVKAEVRAGGTRIEVPEAEGTPWRVLPPGGPPSEHASLAELAAVLRPGAPS